MNDHHPRSDDPERQRALEEFRRLGEKAASAANARAAAVYPAFEGSEALRRLLRAHRDYEELTDLLTEERDMARGSLDLAAMARRRLVALWGGPVLIAMDDPMRTAIADVVIEAMVSRLLFEAASASEEQSPGSDTGSGAVRHMLAAAVEDLGDDEAYKLLAMALRHAGQYDPVAELRGDLGLTRSGRTRRAPSP